MRKRRYRNGGFEKPLFLKNYYRSEEQYRSFSDTAYLFDPTAAHEPHLHTPGITRGIRPGLGGNHRYCDCTKNSRLSSHFVTVLISIQYLSLMCSKYCTVLATLEQWKPEYMPRSTTTTATSTTTTATTLLLTSASWIPIQELHNTPLPVNNTTVGVTPTTLLNNLTHIYELVKDGPSKNEAAGRWRSLSCPSYCTKNVDPVCGSDGVIYKNDCERRKQTCGTDVKKVDLEECTLPNGANCEHKCDKDKDFVCGNDGRSYLNKCFLQVEYCERGIEFSHYGACLNSTATAEETCPSFCMRSLRNSPVCGSDGNVYPSECDMKRETCGQGVVSVDRRHCQTTEHCDSGCWKISRLTCGSDGKLYNNGCQMQRKNCGRHVYEVPVPFCLNKMYRTDCPKDCSKEPQNLVCGSDGNIYRNECELKKLTCGFPLTRYELITVVNFRNCASKNAMCAKLVCSNKEEPVCGNDAVTYKNLCHLRKATCTTGVQLAHVGSCTDPTEKQVCPQKCDTTQLQAVICGSNANTYKSKCEMEMKTCGQHVVEAPLSHCEATKYCARGVKCPRKKRKMVCGSDGQFYGSECEMRKLNCGKHTYVAPIARCLQNFKFVFTGCGRVCPNEYDPVCGTDLKTYSNQCFMEMENCRARSLGGVKRKYYGKCGEPKQNPRNYLFRR